MALEGGGRWPQSPHDLLAQMLSASSHLDFGMSDMLSRQATYPVGAGWGGATTAAPSAAPGDSPPGGPVDIGAAGMLLAALLMAVNSGISVWLRLGLQHKLAVASIRCAVQLSVLGYVLVPIFTFDAWWLTAIYTAFMLAVAAVEAVSRPSHIYSGMLLQVLLAMGVGTACVITYGLSVVVGVRPWYQPQYLIPMLGMLLGNACSGVAIGLSTVLDELVSGRDQVELLLALGASRYEATIELVQRAVRLALLPTLNAMSVVGIVSIPGMMTGQILGGSDPALAARYQIVIYYLVGTSSGLSCVATVFMAVYSVVDGHARLRSERLRGKSIAGKGALPWLAAQAAQGWRAGRARAGHAAARVRRAFASAGTHRHRFFAFRRGPSATLSPAPPGALAGEPPEWPPERVQVHVVPSSGAAGIRQPLLEEDGGGGGAEGSPHGELRA